MILYDTNSLFATCFHSTLGAINKGEFKTAVKDIDLEKLYNEAITTVDNKKAEEIVKQMHPYILKGVMQYIVQFIHDLNMQYRETYGEPVYVFDTSPSWRYSFYPDYKANRKLKERDIFYDTLFRPYINNLKMLLKTLDCKVLDNVKVEMNGKELGAEGDDIIAIIVNKLRYHVKHLIVSSDGDFIQLCDKDVRQYSVLHKTMLETPTREIKALWLENNIILGQSKDNIPSILKHTEFDKDFIKFMKEEHEIDIPKNLSPEDFKELKTKLNKEIIEYREMIIKDSEQKIKEGNAKRLSTKNAFKTIRFGEKGIEKVKEQYGDIESWLNENPLYKENYDRNRKLLDLTLNPRFIFDEVKRQFDNIVNTSLKKDEMQSMLEFDEKQSKLSSLNKKIGFDLSPFKLN